LGDADFEFSRRVGRGDSDDAEPFHGCPDHVRKIYCELALKLRIKPRCRLKREKPEELAVPEAPDVVWSMEFTSVRLADEGQFRLLKLPDDFNRDGLGFEVDFSLPPKGLCVPWTRSSNGVASHLRSGWPNMSVPR